MGYQNNTERSERKLFCYYHKEAKVFLLPPNRSESREGGRTELKTVGVNVRVSRAFNFVIGSAQQAIRVFFVEARSLVLSLPACFCSIRLVAYL